jgi:hypothetical protein
MEIRSRAFQNWARTLGHFRSKTSHFFLVASCVLTEPTRQVDSLAVGSVRDNVDGSQAARTSSSATLHFENTDSLSG